MSDFTNYAEQNLIENVLSGVALSFSTSWFIGLHTGAPGEDGTANEAATSVWTNYARQRIDRSTSGWSTAAAEGGGGFRKANATTVDFGTATLSSDYVISHATLRNASNSTTAGNIWFQGALSTSYTLQNGNPVTIPTTALGFSLR